MKHKHIFILSLLSITLTWAQPAESLQPLNVQTMTEEERRLFGQEPQASKPVIEVESPGVEQVPPHTHPGAVEIIEVPSTPSKVEAQVSPVVSEPVAETAPSKPAPKEEKKGGLSADYAITVNPIGYDSINLDGDTPESFRYFFQLTPAIDLHTVLTSSKGRDTDVSLSYYLTWREYYNKATTSRDWEHGASLGLGHQWSDVVSTSLSTDFVYFFKTGADTNWDNAILWFANPAIKFKVQDNLSFKLGYTALYLQLVDAPISLGDTSPADVEDLRSGAGESYSPTSGYLPSATPTSLDSTQDIWWIENRLVFGTNFSPTPGTDLGLGLSYNFSMVSNDPSMEWKGFYLSPSFGQKMPWKGGKLTIKDELRMRNYDSVLVTGSDVKKQNFRNRLTFELTQEITNSISWSAFYRHQTVMKNEDDFKNKTYTHWFYTGVTFAF